MSLYPLALRLEGRRVLVVGGGAVATRRMPALISSGARIEIVAPLLSPALRGYVDSGQVTWSARRFQPADVDGAWLVQVAIDDPAAAAEVSAAAEARRVFCVRADDRDAATAWTPAVTRHGPVTVAVTDGGDRRRALAVRDLVATALASSPSASVGYKGVALVGAGPGDPELITVKGQRLLAAADVVVADHLAPGMLLGVLSGGQPRRSAAVRDGVLTALRTGSVVDRPEKPREGGVALVGGGPGDPELITVRGRRLLSLADVVVVDRLGPMQLLDELPPHVRVVDAAKIPYGRAASQDVINSTLIEEAKAGKFVVRLKGGDPYLFGRGFEELLACAEAGVPVTIVPGVTSAFGVPAVAGVPVTHRGVAHEVVVVSGHVAPDDPRSLVDWPALARLRGTLVLLMGVERIRAFADALLEGRPADTPVAVIQEGTTRSQRVVRTTLSEVADRVVAEEIRPPAIVVFGPVAALGEHLS